MFTRTMHRLLLFFCCSFAFCQTILGQSTPEEINAVVSEIKPDSIVIGHIIINGNKKTKESIIRRELSIREGDKIAKADLAEILIWQRNRIANTNLFILVDIRPQVYDEFHLAVIIELREQLYTIVYPVFDLADRNFNEWWVDRNRDLRRVKIGLNYRQRNVRGRNETLKATLTLGFSTDLRLGYNIPYINKKQTLGLAVGASYLTSRNIAYTTQNDKISFINAERLLYQRSNYFVALRHRKGYYFTQSVQLGYVDFSVADTVTQLNPYYLGKENLRHLFFPELSYSAVYDKRDAFGYPLKGRYGSLSILHRGLGLTDKIDLLTIEANYQEYLALGHNWFLQLGLAAKLSNKSRQPYLYFRGLGYGSNLIRGYDLYVTDGQNAAVARSTMRKRVLHLKKDISAFMPIGQISYLPLDGYLKTYFDIGSVRNTIPNPTNRLPNKTLWGCGLGFDFVTFYNAVFRFEYSYNSQQKTGFFFYFSADL